VKQIRDEELLKRIGNKISHSRKMQNLTQSQLAYEANLPSMQISRIERGVVNSSISTLSAIAKALDISLKELFDFEAE
jgi:transcriptional regulator with XRE-family HTH domain